MGFINHATNNIIIDAVLTERGRELLSQNNGSFSIASFAFGDDEVDYSLISKFGMNVGKEKIEKNTPIMEANPNENLALKYPLITLTNPVATTSHIPTIIRTDDVNNSAINLVNVSTTSSDFSYDIKLRTHLDNPGVIDLTGLVDTTFLIKMNNNLIRISGVEPIDSDMNGVASYIVSTSSEGATFTGQRFFNFSIFANGVSTNQTFIDYETNVDGKLFTQIQITGRSTGRKLLIPVLITNSIT